MTLGALPVHKPPIDRGSRRCKAVCVAAVLLALVLLMERVRMIESQHIPSVAIPVAIAPTTQLYGGEVAEEHTGAVGAGAMGAGERDELFRSIVSKTKSDKVNEHHYDRMYGQFLIPLLADLHRPPSKRPVKLLEIGLGCDSRYGPGESILIWQQLLNTNDSLWMAEVNASCANTFRNHPRLKNVQVLAGDQGNVSILQSWIRLSDARASPYDVIIDDGSHENPGIFLTFKALWDVLRWGGVYFIEDLQVNRHPAWNPPPLKIGGTLTNLGSYVNDTVANNTAAAAGPSGAQLPNPNPSPIVPVMLDILADWNEQLICLKSRQRSKRKWPLPEGVASISCFRHACVIVKCARRDNSCL